MSTTKDIQLGEFNLGDVDRLRVNVLKNGVPWANLDLVELRFEKPDRVTQFARAAVAESLSGGVWYYDLLTTDLDVGGWWTLSVKVTQGGIVKRYPYEISFYVDDQP